MPKIYLRDSRTYLEEEQFGGKSLQFLYNKRLGRFLLKRYFMHADFSNYNAKQMSSPKSVEKIEETITRYRIDMSEYKTQMYQSFRAFFLRELPPKARPIARAPALISPSDSRLQVFSMDENRVVEVKGLCYTLAELLQDDEMAERFSSSWVFIYRLSMADNHHYIHIADGKNLLTEELSGVLHTVSHYAKKWKVLAENKRVWSWQHVEGIGEMLTMEVGAMQVGAIHNIERKTFKRGQKKGYFDLGGSTIVQIFPIESIKPDEDILEQSKLGFETLVKRGEKVGIIV